eukprot:6210996-Pleurochrysis_carterae.AAC.1
MHAGEVGLGNAVDTRTTGACSKPIYKSASHDGRIRQETVFRRNGIAVEPESAATRDTGY